MAKKQTDNLVKNPSFFRHLGDRMPKEIGWDEVYRLVREDGQVENNTNRYRDCVMQDDVKGAERWKAASGAITPCACCEGGHAMANLVRFTSIGMVDLDDVSDDRLPEVMAKVKGDEHTFMAWVTTSGHGVRVLFRYSFSQAPADGPAPTFADAFRRGNDYYARLTEVSVDEHVKDATRLSFLAHDAEAVWNPDATPFTVRPLDITERSIQEVEERGLRYVEGSRNAYISSVSYLLNRYGMSESEAVEWAKRRFPDYEGTEGVVRSCYKQTDEHGTRSVGRTRKTDNDAAANRKTKYALKPDIKVYLSGQGEYRRNLVTGNRRWLTFEVTDIVDPFTTPVNHEGLYAQAKYLYESGFTYWFNKDDIALIEERNRRYTVPSMEEELISKYYRLPEPGEPVLYQTATDIVEYITSFGVKKLTNARVGIALRKLGYEKIERNRRYYYLTIRLSMEDIDARQRGIPSQTPF